MRTYNIVMHAQKFACDFMTGLSYEEALEICTSMNWVYIDENEFPWDLSIDD